MWREPWRVEAGGISVSVRLTPRGGRDAVGAIEVLADGRAVVTARVRAAPEKGAANAALEALLARALGVPKSRASVVSGGTGRVKVVRIEGEPAELVRGLAAATAQSTPG